MVDPETDQGVEGAAIRRLASAARRTRDFETAGAALTRAMRLAREVGLDLNDPQVIRLLNIDGLPNDVDNNDD